MPHKSSASIEWNQELRLPLADVDETIADIYMPAEPEMITELGRLLADGYPLFLVTGGGLEHVKRRVTDQLANPENILVSHCSGAEVWGFRKDGVLKPEPFYSIYEETFSPEQKERWREAVDRLLQEYKLRPHTARPIAEFIKEIGTDPLDVILDDRGPQITLEIINGADMSDSQLETLEHEVPLTNDQRDLRVPILGRAEELFAELQIPITPRLGGTFALDFAIEGVSKETSIRKVLDDPKILETVGLTKADVTQPSHLEIWGDKFSTIRGGSDRHMCEALPPEVRAIDFREENPEEFLPGYNIVLWDGEQHLHHGLLEYLQAR